MGRIYPDATTLIALGGIGELSHLLAFDGQVCLLNRVCREVTTEPAATNLDRFRDRPAVDVTTVVDDTLTRARETLGESEINGDVCLIAMVLENPETVAVVSDDRRVRRIADGLGARVTGTIGVVVRAVHEGLSAEEAKATIERLDDHGLHMTAELRNEAIELVESAAQEDRSDHDPA